MLNHNSCYCRAAWPVVRICWLRSQVRHAEDATDADQQERQLLEPLADAGNVEGQKEEEQTFRRQVNLVARSRAVGVASAKIWGGGKIFALG